MRLRSKRAMQRGVTIVDSPSLLCQTAIFSARCNIYISRLCYDVTVRLSVTEVHWRIIANLGFKFRFQFTAHCGRGACGREGRDHRREEWGIISRCASHYY